jgi:serine-type D-Ala-D-Ala carboxypeptidase/endopeptidase (penicillin-binding protein 4)
MSFRLLRIVLFIFLGSSAYAGSLSGILLHEKPVLDVDRALQKRMAPLIHTIEQSSQLSIIVKDLRSNTIVFAHRPDQWLLPASLQKTTTMLLALKYLGLEYTFQTKVYWQPVSASGRDGNLWIHFVGDPSFTEAQLEKMIHKVLPKNVRTLHKVFVDAQAFDPLSYGPGWMWDERDDAYAAPVSALILDGNMFQLHLHASAGKARLWLNKNLPFRFKTNITLAAASESCKLAFHPSGYDRYLLEGCMHNQEEQIMDVAIKDPQTMLQFSLNNFFRKRHILYPERYLWKSFKETEVSAFKVVTHKSLPLWKLLAHMSKRSDNLYAEAIFQTLAAKRYGYPGSWEKAQHFACRSFSGLSAFRSCSIMDGSGLSRYNQANAAQISRVLDGIYSSMDWRAKIPQLFATPGEPGTLLESRLSKFNGYLHLKTGSMSGVTNIAGYAGLFTRPYSLVILVNGVPKEPQKERQLIWIDQLVNELANYAKHSAL